MRAAVFYAPEPDDPLWQAGIAWLGRDPARGDRLDQPALPDIASATASPRRYGFHATLKPPMTLAYGLDRFLDDVRSLTGDLAPIEPSPFAVGRLDGFLAIVETVPSPSLRALAKECVIRLDAHRIPETAADIARRSVGIDETGRSYLARYGYPHVLDRWSFHMTLSEQLPPRHPLEAAARAHFARACAVRRQIGSLAVYVERRPAAAFELVTRLPFRS